MQKYVALLFLLSLLWSCGKDEESPVIVKACFSFEFSRSNDGEVTFTNCSEHAISYLWEFGDGEISSETNPVHTYTTEPPYYVSLIASSRYQKDTFTTQLYYDDIVVYKPNIYLYPTKETNLCLEIDFPLGGEVTESIPEYSDGWCFHVLPDGTIDNEYTYLFYESSQPDIFQYQKGWCVSKDHLMGFFENNMQQYNFLQPEINDFTEYWIPRLTEYNYYLIYPQTNEIIDKVICFNFSAQPDNLGRLFYAISGTNKQTTLPEPETKVFLRDNFFVMEWGVILK